MAGASQHSNACSKLPHPGCSARQQVDGIMLPGVLSPAGAHLQVIRDALRLLEVMTKRRQPHHI
jgi:hypothetical protein